MGKKKIFDNSYFTAYDIAKESGKPYQSIYYHIRSGHFPKPSMEITYIRFIGDHIKNHKITLWNKKKVATIMNRLAKVSPGHYKRFIHPITKKNGKFKRRKEFLSGDVYRKRSSSART